MELQWIPSHDGVPANESPDSLATQAHAHNDPTIILNRFADARLVRQVTLIRHPDTSVSLGTFPSLVSRRGILRSDAAFLHRPRGNSVSTRS